MIIQPEFLQPRLKTTQSGDVLSVLKEGDKLRGRTLFHQARAAACSACHQLEGHGNVFAPDLQDIGSRAQADVMVRSILEPSAEITEGFVSQTIETQQGEIYEGLIVSESGRAVTLANASGQTVEVLKKEIATRKSSNVSAMPSGQGDMLSPVQVADIVAYLMDAHEVDSSDPKEDVASLAPGKNVISSEQRVSSERVKIDSNSINESLKFVFLDDGVEVRIGDQPIARYYHKHPSVHRPFWAHIRTPRGSPVTRHFPPVDGIDAGDHAHMHPGLSMGFAVLNGVNFWHNREGKVVHQGYQNVLVDEDKAGFSTRQFYLNGSGDKICEETSDYVFRRNEDGYLLTWDALYKSGSPFYFGVKEEMGLTLRVATPIVVKTGQGRILASHGGINEAGTWGKVADWWDYAGAVEGRFLGLHLMSGPGNPEVWSHSRDYGVLVANPFPVDLKPNRGIQTEIRSG